MEQSKNEKKLNVDVEVRQGPPTTALVTLSGYIETVQAREMRSLFGEIEKNLIRRMILDMSQVGFISSAGLGLLVSYSNEKKSQWGQKPVVLVGLQESVMKTMRLMGLAGFFYILDTMEDAKREFGLD